VGGLVLNRHGSPRQITRVDLGNTDLENLVSLCRPHHRAVHEQGWRIHIADGLAVVEPPP